MLPALLLRALLLVLSHVLLLPLRLRRAASHAPLLMLNKRARSLSCSCEKHHWMIRQQPPMTDEQVQNA